MALIFSRATFPDADLMQLFDLFGNFHMLRRTSAGHYIHVETGHVLIKIETGSLIMLL